MAWITHNPEKLAEGASDPVLDEVVYALTVRDLKEAYEALREDNPEWKPWAELSELARDAIIRASGEAVSAAVGGNQPFEWAIEGLLDRLRPCAHCHQAIWGGYQMVSPDAYHPECWPKVRERQALETAQAHEQAWGKEDY